MVEFINIKKIPKDEKVLDLLRPYVKEWFKRNFKELTLPQKFSIPLIKKGKNVLITSPTGSGKTLSMFASILDELFRLGEKAKLEDKVYCIYISPLRALDNDIYKNLLVPLKEIREIAKEMGKELPEVRVSVRTGDTLPSERQQQLKCPPHILITTPESIAIILSTRKFKEKLKDVRWVIVDEIHELADSKRGVHLSLSLERLQNFVGKPFVRIGAGATLEPLEECAKFLVGYENGKERDCKIIDARFVKKMDIKLLSPTKDLLYTSAEEITNSMYKLLDKLISKHRTTLVFTNTRSGTERCVHHLKQMFPNVYTDDQIGAHHSSVSREIRHEIEDKLKKGELKVCVCVDKNSEVLLSGGKWKKITALKDEKLITLNLETLKLESCKFKGISERNDKNIEGLLIKTSTGKEIKCTKEHKLLTINDGVLTWKNAENLKVGEFIATIRCNRTFSKNIPSYFEFLTPNVYLELSPFLRAKLKMELIKKFGLLKNATKHLGISYSVLKNSLAGIQHISYKDLNKVCNSLGISVQNLVQCTDKIGSDKRAIKLKQTNFSSNFIKFVGFLLSDGTFNKHSFAIFSEDRDLLENYTSLIKEEFNLNFTDIVNPYGISGKRSSSTLICGMLIKLGLPMKKKSINAIVPESFFSMPKDYVWEFLSGYFDGDGYLEVKSDGRVYSAGFVTFSKKMAEGLQKLLLKLGIISSIREREYNEKQKYRGRIISKKGTCYTVSVFGGEHLRKFAANINPFRKSHFRIKSVLRMKGHCNRDVIPNLGPILKKLRDELGLSTYFMQRNFKINPMKYEIGARNITRKKLLQLLGIYLNFGYNKTIEYLLKIANSDIFWDKIKEIKKIKLEKAYDIVDSGKFHNFIVNGIITKNSSTSLELGIDIGYIDQVIQLGSPKSITRLVQRVGRGGHTLEKTSVGRVIAMDRDDQVELAVMIQQAYKYFLDKIHIPQNCLDVLAQHLMGMSLEKKWNIREAFNLVRNSYCYRNLDWKTFLSVLEFLSGAYHSLEEKKVYGKIWVDFNDMMFGRRGKYARVIYSLNIGTIPDEVKIKVRTLDGRYIGSIEEEFLQRLLPGDIFVLAGKTYEFVKAREVTAYVRPVKEKRPTVPAWFSEMLPLSFELALKIQEFRGKMFELIRKKEKKEVVEWLLKNYYLDEWSANSIYEYFLWEYKFLKALGAKRFPDEKTILVENYVDERGNQNIIFHTLFGRRINDALSRAFGYLLTKRLKKSVGLTISDNGFVISIPCEPLGKGWLDIISLREKISRRESERIKPEEIVKLLKSENLKEVLRKALRQTELIKRRFRHCATRSLMILRNYKGYEIKVARQQFNADRLLRVCEKFENFPVVEETYREVMEDFMDIEHARWLLEQIEKGKIKYEFLPESNVPSPFAHNLIALGETDVVLMEDRKRLLLELHKKVMEKVNQS